MTRSIVYGANVDIDMGANPITNVEDPTNDQDAATKKYVDNNAGGGIPQGGPLTEDLDADGNTLLNLTDPTLPQQPATKAYADALVNGLTWKQAVDLATAAALPANTYSNGASGVGATITGTSFGALTVDGVTVTTGMRVLVKDETSGSHNGIYTVTTVGAVATLFVLTRATDFDQGAEIKAGDAVFVTQGTANADTAWVLTTTGAITVGTTALTFVQFGTGTFDLAGTIHAATGKTTPVDNDELALIDSAASNVLKKLLWSNVKATLKTYFDTLYASSSGTAPIGVSELIYRYTVSGSDKASIDTGADTANAGSNDWTNGDVLEVWILCQTDEAGVQVNPLVTVNNDSTGIYDQQRLSVTNTAVSGAPANAQNSWLPATTGQGSTQDYPGVIRITIPGYAATVFKKTGEMTEGYTDSTAGNNFAGLYTIGWRSTAAITRMKIAAAGAAKLKVGSQLLIYKRRSA